MTAVRCADLSEAAGESLAATATTAQRWLLVEVYGTWARDVGDGTGLGVGNRGKVAEWLAAAPSSRVLFVRQPGRARDRRLVLVVLATEQDVEVRRIALSPHDDLCEVDLDADGERTDAPLVLVCGHGTRDACCARRGNAVYGALASHLAPDELWLSSHQGGHRFAANVLILPSGIQLGRVAVDDATRVVGDALAGRIALEHYRGRTVYTAREQAAERAVRDAAGLTSVSDLTLVGDDGLHVRFVESGGREHCALPQEISGPAVRASCGVEPEPQSHFVAALV